MNRHATYLWATGLGLLAASGAWAGREDADFDGDGMTDLCVYHAARGDWYVRGSRDYGLRFQNWGWHQSQPVPGDYDGDGRADLCVFSGRGGEWYVLQSRDNAFAITRGWGNPTQDPVCGDFDGDGRNDLAVYDPANGYWYIRQSGDGKVVGRQWGGPTMEPVPGDYNGDGRTDLAVYERAKGNWAILFYGVETARFANWGWSEAEPVQADYDGDGRTDLAVYHPSSGDWYIEQSGDQALRLVHSGWYNVQPNPGYFDPDSQADVAAYFAQQGVWLIRPSALGGEQVVANWGWKDAESAFASYRVDDDGAHYGVAFQHDYDDDTFEASDDYPRTGFHAGLAAPATGGSTGGGSSDSGGSAINLSKVSWLHANVGGWGQTAKLRVKVNRSTITLEYNKASTWPGRVIGDKSLNANPWIFVPKSDGTGWYAATWEWMKVGQTTKNRSSVAGDHIKKSPLQSFAPQPGAWYGFMVSGLARSSVRNVSERSNIVMVQWPADGQESRWFE